MDIIFSPAIGDSIQVETSLSSQTILLHFTAELTERDQDKLIQDGARIQLWADLPRNDQSLSEGDWGAFDFPYRAQATEEMSSSHKISLGNTYPIPAIGEKATLFLPVIARTSRPFSFTYRIIYPSGDIQWLGAFLQNGSLSFQRSDYDLHNFGLHSWTFDKSRMAHTYEVKQSVGTLIVARVRDVYNYRVQAIGPTSFVSDLKEAALLLFVPRSQSSAISLLPTYVFSASPGSSLTLSADGHLIASGSGTLLFQANDGHDVEPLTFIRQMLSHAELGGWNIPAWDVGSKSIVLTTPKDKLPIKAVTIPLWHSKGLICPIHLGTTTLCDLLGSTEFSIFSPDNMRIHLFTVAPQAALDKQIVCLQSDTTGNELVMSPIYTLQATTDKSATIWKMAVLSPYQAQDSSSDDSGVLPTPPPSPHLQPIAHLSQGHSSYDAAMSSVPSLPSDTLQSPINGNDEPETPPPPSPPLNSDTNARNTLQRPNWPFSQSIVTAFRSLFFSFFFIYRFFWGHRIFGPLTVRRGNTAMDRPQSQVSTGPEDDVLSSLDEDAPDDSGESGSESLVRIPETNILREGNTEIQTTEARPSPSHTVIPEPVTQHGVSSTSDKTKGDVYYLQTDSSSNKTITIALLCTTHNDSSPSTEGTITSHNTPSATSNKIMERCVQFLDGSKPECVVSRCDVFYHGQARSGSTESCILLQYQLDGSSDLEKSERRIRISPPSFDLLD